MGLSDITADEVLNPGLPREAPERDGCVEFLREMLSDGPLSAGIVLEAAEANGFAAKTIERAKKKAGITSFKETGKGGAWYWELEDR